MSHGARLPALRALALALALAVAVATGAATAQVLAAPDQTGEDNTVILPRKARPRLTAPSRRRAAADSDESTRCAACHVVEGWEKVRFNHDPTGFPLRGAHVDVTCAGCHEQSFETPIADTCAGCHRDRHGGELGMRCEGCHDERSWRPLFNADGHRRTNFPLSGKHAMIPCTECHGNLRDRAFVRAAVRCDACHEGQFQRTAATSIDHVANNYSRDCQACHNTFRFFPATVGSHDACFRISSGSHHGIRCLACHTSLATGAFSGTCSTGTYTCAECHSHACARSDAQHRQVMGYECATRKCYECHGSSF